MNLELKYNNDINSISFGNFTEKELNLFFSICYKLKNQGVQTLEIPFKELEQISNCSLINKSRFINSLESTYDKLIQLNITIKFSKLSFSKYNLFQKYTVNAEKEIIIIGLSEQFEFLLNEIVGNYTRLDLVEFINLKSSYSKNMYKLLKQWDSLQVVKFNLIALKEVLGVPETYDTSNFNKRVLKPIMAELPNYFSDLKLEKIKTKNKITDLKFTWKKKRQIKEVEKIELEISSELNNKIKKAKKNRFIEQLLSNENINTLLHIFSEEELKKGLDYAYTEVKREIKFLSYLIKTIKSGIEKKEVKLKIKENEMQVIQTTKKVLGEIDLNELEVKKELTILEIAKEELVKKIMKLDLKMNKKIELNITLENVKTFAEFQAFLERNNLK